MITEEQVRYWLDHRHTPTIADRLVKPRAPVDHHEWATIAQAAADLASIEQGLFGDPLRSRTLAALSAGFSAEALKLLRSCPQIGTAVRRQKPRLALLLACVGMLLSSLGGAFCLLGIFMAGDMGLDERAAYPWYAGAIVALALLCLSLLVLWRSRRDRLPD